MAVPSVGEMISETTTADGGPSKGSAAAAMQGEVGKTRNFEQAAQEVGSKMQTQPQSITAEDANYLKSREARATGTAQPPSDSMSAEAQRLAATNEKDESLSSAAGPLDPSEQSAIDRAKNFEHDADAVASKMANNPEQVTKQDGDLLHSREQRAFGTTSKGGIASQAQSLASENEKKSSS